MDKYLIRKPRAKKKRFLKKNFRNTLGKIPGVATGHKYNEPKHYGKWEGEYASLIGVYWINGNEP